MAENRVNKIVRFLYNRLHSDGIDVDRIVIFGSAAKNKMKKNSDIDLIIISDSFKGKNIFKRAEMVGPAEMATIGKFMVPLDIIMKTNKEYNSGRSLIVDYAKEDGIQIYS